MVVEREREREREKQKKKKKKGISFAEEKTGVGQTEERHKF
jgi:hypothetical protein